MTPLERLSKLRDHLLSLDSGSGEAADLGLALYAITTARGLQDALARMTVNVWPHTQQLGDALDALTEDQP